VVLVWLLANPAVTAPIIGRRTLEQFENTLRVVDIVLTEDVLKKFDKIFPARAAMLPKLTYGKSLPKQIKV